MYAVTRTGTTVKSFKKDVKSVTSGSNLGIIMLPFTNLITVIPTVITRNTTAKATDKADVKLNESATKKNTYFKVKIKLRDINKHATMPNSPMFMFKI